MVSLGQLELATLQWRNVMSHHPVTMVMLL